MKMPKWTLEQLVDAWIIRTVRRAPSLSEAARRLGLHRRTLQRKLYKIKAAQQNKRDWKMEFGPTEYE